MDFGDLIILLIFLVPVLRRIFGKKQPKPRPVPPPEGTTSRRIEDPLAEALRQIREAMGEEQAVEPRSQREVIEAPRVSTAAARDPEFHALGKFEHERHGFGRENPISEEVFEQQPAFVTTGGTKPIRTSTPKAVDLTTPLEVAKPSAPSASLAHLLRDPKRARDAFILHEVLGPPKSRRR